jgi:hypothetical protein
VVSGELERIRQITARMLQVIEEAFDARAIRVGKDGELIDLGRNHHGRLAAVGSSIKLMTTGRPAPKAVEAKKGDGTMTLAELQARVGENVERGLRDASQDPPARTL